MNFQYLTFHIMQIMFFFMYPLLSMRQKRNKRRLVSHYNLSLSKSVSKLNFFIKMQSLRKGALRRAVTNRTMASRHILNMYYPSRRYPVTVQPQALN